MTTERAATVDLRARARLVAAAAAKSADEVDRASRFPAEAVSAAKEHRLLGTMVPPEFGGEGASVSDIADICYVLGRACASTAMIFAMHQIMVKILVRHGRGSAWHEQLLRRLSSEQLLLASSTTEGEGGGDLRQSACAVERAGLEIALSKTATVISYGAEADGLLATARRSPESEAANQILVAFAKPDYRLERTLDWDALGMRGTLSAGFLLKGSGRADQILPDPYARIHAETMMPVAHLTWGAVWTGIAAEAVARARQFIRASARRSNGQLPPGAAHLARAAMSLGSLRALLAAALRRYEAAEAGDALETLDFQTAMNLLKVNASELAVATVMSAMQVCGLSGYRNGGEFSLSRHLRDVLSSSVMINNDRILAHAAGAATLADVPDFLRD